MTSYPKSLVPHFFDNTAKTYEKIASWTTFGKDNYWKKEIVAKITHVNSVLDLACGTGKLTRLVAQKFPHAKIIGVDISQSYLDIANQNPTSNISFIHNDAEHLQLEQTFDCICSSYIPKYCDSKILIQRCIEHLNSTGLIIFHDFVLPQNKLVKLLWKFYFVLLKLLGNFIPSWKYAFSELPKLIQQSKWVDEYSTELKKNGFDVKQQFLTWNTSAILCARKNNL